MVGMVGVTSNYPIVTAKELVEKKLEEIRRLKATKLPEQIKDELPEIVQLAAEAVYTIYTRGVFYDILEAYILGILCAKYPDETKQKDPYYPIRCAQDVAEASVFLSKLNKDGIGKFVVPISFKEAASLGDFCELLVEFCELESPGLAEQFKKD